MRFHCLGLPHTVTSNEYNACAYTQKVRKFIKMMVPRGHECIHYGHERSEVPGAQHVTVTDDAVLHEAYGDHDWRAFGFLFSLNDHATKTFNANAIRLLHQHKRPGDFLLCFWGASHQPIADAHPDMTAVEPGIGYSRGHFAKYKAFESYALMHAWHGLEKFARADPWAWVIPNYFDPTEFAYQEEKDDYLLYIGRIGGHKGVHLAIQAAHETKQRLVIAGQGSLASMGYSQVPSNIEFVGYADVEKRRTLMANAKGAFLLSQYLEPFGGVHVECLLSGTPIITSDWGAFAETNLHGVTGYRCRTFGQRCEAVRNIGRIAPQACRAWAENYTLDRVAPMFEEFFQAIDDDRAGNVPSAGGLDWLDRAYPTE